jgi:L-amino acid N-acyltransferase YncA
MICSSDHPDGGRVQIRLATVADASAIREIYRPCVEDSATSFELELPTIEEMGRRITTSLERWAWLVAEENGVVVGYAYGGMHRQRAAYRHSVERSAYVHQAHHRKGVARRLYETLLGDLSHKGYESAYAGITMPNEASYAFHLSLGFEPIGLFPRIGRKFDRWHDVAWLYRPVRLNRE